MKWAGPSIEASRRSRAEIEMENRMRIPPQKPIRASPLSLITIFLFGLLPFVVIISLFFHPKTILITDSIPNHRVLVISIMALLSILIACLNRRMFDKNFYGWVPAAFFIAGSLINVSCSDWYYRMACEEYLFSGKTSSYSRAVFVNHLSIVHQRQGPDFFGHVNPNNVSTIDPKIEITRTLYNVLATTSLDGAVVPNGFPTCSVRVAVERSGNAERIVTRSLVNTSDVVECQRPM